MKAISKYLLLALAAVLYGIGFAAHKVALTPGWIAAAVRVGWDDAR
ncbi:hypothetical protein [Streptomyces sp. NPDC015131]